MIIESDKKENMIIESDQNEKKKVNAFDVILENSKSKKTNVKPSKNFYSNNFGGGLLPYIKNPEANKEFVIYHDNDIVAIKDKFPKARVHILLLPRQAFVDYSQLTIEHVPTINNLKQKGLSLQKDYIEKDPKLSFRMGFHALPSMRYIHMHLISQDFDSPTLKTKKHWNSFTTDYFIDIDDFIQRLEQNGKIEYDTKIYEAMLKQNLKCNICHISLSTIPSINFS